MKGIVTATSASFGNRSDAERRQEVKETRKAIQKLVETPGAAREFLIKHGFMTKKGKLPQRYR